MSQTIFHFDDAVDYLQFRLGRAKKSNPRVTVRSWALKLKISHPMNLSRILKRERRLTVQMAKKLGPELGLKVAEQSYFELLADAAQAKDKKLFKQYHELTLLHKQIPNTLTLKEFKCFARWFVGPLMESLSLKKIVATPENIAKLFESHVSYTEMTAMIKILVDLKLLNITETGVLKSSQDQRPMFNIHSSVREAAIESYLNGQLEQSRLAFQRLPVGKRKMTSASIAISARDVTQAKKIIDEAVQKLLKLTQTEEADCVYQFNAQFFPVLEIDSNT